MNREEEKRFIDFCIKEGFDISKEESNQRKAVLSNAYSVLPSGAGSGKTTVLTYRFLRLIFDEKIHSNEILTITFTKAATANMRSKIYMLLKKAIKANLIDKEELDYFTSSEISTTDSFCSSILRKDCIRYGLSPAFSIEDDIDYDEFASLTLRNIIEEKIEREEDVRKIASLISYENLLSAFLIISKTKLSLVNGIAQTKEEYFEKIKGEIVTILNKTIEEKREKLIKLTAQFIDILGSYSSINDDIKHVSNISSYINGGEIVTSTFSRKVSVISKNDELNGFYKDLKKRIKETFSDYLSYLNYRDNADYSLLRGYSSLLVEFEKRIFHHKREKALLTFHDVMLLSIDILKTNLTLRNYYNKKFKKIMVDEFQDNNEENKKLVYLLAAKKSFTSTSLYPSIDDIELDKIFMVGDEKQSIYRFRGADVSVFKAISDDFGEDRVLPLSVNFRSEKKIIDTINKIFSSKIMPLKNESSENYEAIYTPLSSDNNRVESQISFRYMNAKENIKNSENKDDLASAVLSEAYEVGRIIKEEILGKDKDKYLVSYFDKEEKKLKTREPKAEDIAILLRKTSNQSSFERALRLFDIPFNVSDNKSLTMDSLFNDFYSILQYSVYSLDDPLALLSTLRSPFINMSDIDIERISENISENRELSSNLSSDAIEQLDRFNTIIDELREKEKKGTLASLISYLYYDTGYRFLLESDERNRSYSEHFDYLFTIASNYDETNKTLIELLDRMRESLGDVSSFKDLNVLKDKTVGVTIQTIHKSKGLEYPICIISDMAGQSPNSSFTPFSLPSTLPIIPYFEDQNKLINPIEKCLKKNNNKIENAETKRVLYVAATRSVNHLIFTSNFSDRAFEKDILSRPKDDKINSMLSYLLEGLDFTLEDKTNIIDSREFFPVPYSLFRSNSRKRKDNKEIESWYDNPKKEREQTRIEKIGVTTLIKEEENEISPLALSRLNIDSILFRKDDELSEEENERIINKRVTDFGTLVHLLIENYLLKINDNLESFFTDESEREKIIKEAYSLRDGFLSSNLYNSIKDYNLFPEKEFYILDDTKIVDGIIDLLAISENKIIIVDYKTDSQIKVNKHKAQLEYYKKAIESIYSNRTVECYLFYLRHKEERRVI